MSSKPEDDTPVSVGFEIGPNLWMTSNMRLHRLEMARRTRKLREKAHWATKIFRTPKRTTPHGLTVTIGFPNRRRVDITNITPTIKPLLDGLIDGKLLPDDNLKYIPLFSIIADRDYTPPRPDIRKVTFTFTPIERANNDK